MLELGELNKIMCIKLSFPGPGPYRGSVLGNNDSDSDGDELVDVNERTWETHCKPMVGRGKRRVLVIENLLPEFSDWLAMNREK